METCKTIHREHSLSSEGVGRNRTVMESICLENGSKFLGSYLWIFPVLFFFFSKQGIVTRFSNLI